MPIPGQNLLNMALTLIAKQAVIYYRFAGRSLNSVGQDVTSYDQPIVIVGSFQPVPRALYDKYGLNFQKDYYMFYTSNDTWDIQRDVSGDQISLNGRRYQCESNTEWFSDDFWKGILCVYVGLDPADRIVWGFGSNPPNTYVNFGNGNFLGQET